MPFKSSQQESFTHEQLQEMRAKIEKDRAEQSRRARNRPEIPFDPLEEDISQPFPGGEPPIPEKNDEEHEEAAPAPKQLPNTGEVDDPKIPFPSPTALNVPELLTWRKQYQPNLEVENSNFALDYSTLKYHGGDSWATYKQALQELNKYGQAVYQLSHRRDTISAMFDKSQPHTTRHHTLEMELEEVERSLNSMARLFFWCFGVVKELHEEFGDVTPEQRYALDARSQMRSLIKQIAIERLTQPAFSANTFKRMTLLPEGERIEVALWMKRIKEDEAVAHRLALGKNATKALLGEAGGLEGTRILDGQNGRNPA